MENKTRRCHYIPQCYLRNFSTVEDKNKIHCYNLNPTSYKNKFLYTRESIKNLFFEDYFYHPIDEDSFGKDVETVYGKSIEKLTNIQYHSDMSESIENFLYNKEKTDDIIYSLLVMFITLQTRNPEFLQKKRNLKCFSSVKSFVEKYDTRLLDSFIMRTFNSASIHDFLFNKKIDFIVGLSRATNNFFITGDCFIIDIKNINNQYNDLFILPIKHNMYFALSSNSGKINTKSNIRFNIIDDSDQDVFYMVNDYIINNSKSYVLSHDRFYLEEQINSFL